MNNIQMSIGIWIFNIIWNEVSMLQFSAHFQRICCTRCEMEPASPLAFKMATGIAETTTKYGNRYLHRTRRAFGREILAGFGAGVGVICLAGPVCVRWFLITQEQALNRSGRLVQSQ